MGAGSELKRQRHAERCYARSVAFPPILLLVACLACASPPPSVSRPAAGPPPLILVSLDGFRPDYTARYGAPNLARLAEAGVHAPQGMIPVFPSKTFPNHYSIVTGLYPEHHGIVSNTIYDPERDAWFRIGDAEAIADPHWWGGEPIWVTAQRQGLRSATFFWVGSEAPVRGVQPTYWKPYDGSIPGAERVDQVLRWLDLPAHERPHLITLYFSAVDSAGHRHGPDSVEVARAVQRVDAHLGRLIQGLEARGLAERVNLVVLSDHGMAATSSEQVIVLDDYLDLSEIRIVERSPVLMLHPRPGKLGRVLRALDGAHPHLAIYSKEQLPARLHFGDHPRIPPVIGLADEGWTIRSSRRKDSASEAQLGTHGYDGSLRSMRALFVASGPSFQKRLEIEPFENIQLYELFCALLGVEAAPNDGELDVLRRVLAAELRSGAAVERPSRAGRP
jgi:predicted AlkP superfamily pyrophosphatase or phosphodiesterase